MAQTNPPHTLADDLPTQDNLQKQNSVSETAHFLDYWQILYSRKEIIIAVSILLILSGIIITRRMPRVYAAQAVIEVQRETPNIDLFGQSSTRYDPYFLRTQFEIIKSDPVIEQVVREANLAEELGAAYGWKASSSAQGATERTINLVKRSTTLDIYRDTNLISIAVELSKPEQPDGEAAKVAARIANTIAKVFLDYTRNKNKTAVENALNTLQNEINELDRQISAAEDDLAALRAENGIRIIGDSDTGADSYRRQLQRVTEQLNDALMLAKAKKGKYDRIVELSLDEAAIIIPILTGDNSIAPHLANQQNLQMKATALKNQGLLENHPAVIENSALLSDVSAKIKEHVDNIKLGLKYDWELAQEQVNIYQARLDQLSKEERSISAGVAIRMEKLMRELDIMKQRRATIESRMDDERIKLAMPKTSVEIIEPAKVPEIPLPISPNFALNVTLSVAAGLFFGVALAFFVEYLDTTVKSVEDVERYINLNVLGIIPQKIRPLNEEAGSSSKNSEVFRILRMNIKSTKNLASGKTVLFTSASAGEGKSTISFNTSWICAENNDRVLLIDCDLYHPRQHKILGLDQTPGIANVLVGEAALQDSIVKTALPNLDFLPVGRISSGHSFGLLDTDEMAELLKTVSEHYDRIIIDAPPIIGVSDTSQLARLCDGVVMVIQHRKYPRALIRRAKNSVITMGGNLLGVVLNNVNVAHDPSSYYYDHQYYYYYYTSNSKGKVTRTRRASSHSKSESKS